MWFYGIMAHKKFKSDHASKCYFECASMLILFSLVINLVCYRTPQFEGHRSLIKNKTQTAVINIVSSRISIRDVKFIKMRKLTMFITAVSVFYFSSNFSSKDTLLTQGVNTKQLHYVIASTTTERNLSRKIQLFRSRLLVLRH